MDRLQLSDIVECSQCGDDVSIDDTLQSDDDDDFVCLDCAGIERAS